MARTYKRNKYAANRIKICDACCSLAAGPAMLIHFVYEGVEVTAFKSGFVCRMCVQSSWLKNYIANYKEIVRIKSGRISIDWNNCLQLDQDKFIELLVQIGVLDLNGTKGYLILEKGRVLSPQYQGKYCTFLKKSHATGYVKMISPVSYRLYRVSLKEKIEVDFPRRAWKVFWQYVRPPEFIREVFFVIQILIKWFNRFDFFNLFFWKKGYLSF